MQSAFHVDFDIALQTARRQTSGFTGSFPATAAAGGSLVQSDFAYWFYVFNPNAAVGGPGPTGLAGPTGAKGAFFKSYDYGVNILPTNDPSNNVLHIGMDSLRSGGNVMQQDNIKITYDSSGMGWIYPTYGGAGNLYGLPSTQLYTLGNNALGLNWSDRSSFPTDGWNNGSESDGTKGLYAVAIGRSIDRSFLITEKSVFSWMFGPYDGGNIVGDFDRNNNPRSMNLYIVRIPCTDGIPQRSNSWEWVKIEFNIATSSSPLLLYRCGHNALVDMDGIDGRPKFQGVGVGDGSGGGDPPTGGGAGGNLLPLSVNAGDALGIYIAEQQLFYTKTNQSTNHNFLISPATFSLKVEIEE
jgi:hypothetical protein